MPNHLHPNPERGELVCLILVELIRPVKAIELVHYNPNSGEQPSDVQNHLAFDLCKTLRTWPLYSTCAPLGNANILPCPFQTFCYPIVMFIFEQPFRHRLILDSIERVIKSHEIHICIVRKLPDLNVLRLTVWREKHGILHDVLELSFYRYPSNASLTIGDNLSDTVLARAKTSPSSIACLISLRRAMTFSRLAMLS